MRIGELARQVGVSTDTVRFYERSGWLPARFATRQHVPRLRRGRRRAPPPAGRPAAARHPARRGRPDRGLVPCRPLRGGIRRAPDAHRATAAPRSPSASRVSRRSTRGWPDWNATSGRRRRTACDDRRGRPVLRRGDAGRRRSQRAHVPAAHRRPDLSRRRSRPPSPTRGRPPRPARPTPSTGSAGPSRRPGRSRTSPAATISPRSRR